MPSSLSLIFILLLCVLIFYWVPCIVCRVSVDTERNSILPEGWYSFGQAIVCVCVKMGREVWVSLFRGWAGFMYCHCCFCLQVTPYFMVFLSCEILLPLAMPEGFSWCFYSPSVGAVPEGTTHGLPKILAVICSLILALEWKQGNSWFYWSNFCTWALGIGFSHFYLSSPCQSNSSLILW